MSEFDDVHEPFGAESRQESTMDIEMQTRPATTTTKILPLATVIVSTEPTLRQRNTGFKSSKTNAEAATTIAVAQSTSSSSGVTSSKKPKKTVQLKDEVPMTNLIAMTAELQRVEEEREVQRKLDTAREETEQQSIRNQRWAEVKARMSARATPLPSVKSREWDDSEDEEAGGESATLTMPTDPFMDAPRPLAKKLKREKLSWSVRVWHSVYNWVLFITFALSYSPGVNMYDVNKPDSYYTRKTYE